MKNKVYLIAKWLKNYCFRCKQSMRIDPNFCENELVDEKDNVLKN